MDAVASTGSQVSLGEGMDLATEPIQIGRAHV